MKSILSTACLLAFTIGMAFSTEIKGDKIGGLNCANHTVALSCIKGIEQFASNSKPKKNHRARFLAYSDDMIVVKTNETYNACTDFTKELTDVVNCKTCTPRYFDSKNPNYCVYEQPQYGEDKLPGQM